VDFAATVRAGAAGLIQVTGPVTLNNPRLVISTMSTPAVGEQFTVIDNDGSDPVSGTFQNLPEGSTVGSALADFSLTYRGGDGNDVVIKAIPRATTTATLAASPSPSTYGQPVTFTATITASSGTPTGLVYFWTDNSQDPSPASMTGGSATYTTSSLEPGIHRMIAVYAGAPGFGLSQSPGLTPTVQR